MTAKYISRVGGMALALGLGAAVATGHGVAWAEPDPGDSTDASENSAEPDAPEPDDSVDAEDEASGDDVGDDPDEEEPEEEEPSEEDPAEEEPAAAGPEDGDPADPQPAEPTPPAPEVPTTSDASDRTDQPPAPAADDVVVNDDDDEPDDVVTTGRFDSETDFAAERFVESEELVDAPALETALFSLDAPTEGARLTALQPPALPTPAAVAESVMEVFANIFGALGLSPLAAPGPTAPTAPPTLWAVLAWVRREIQHTFFNQSPTLTYDPTANTLVEGTDHIKLGVTVDDPEGDPVVISVVDQPANGVIYQTEDGVFYDPYNDHTGDDTFTLAVEDEGFHFHGLLSLLTPNFGHNGNTQQITVERNTGSAPRITNVIDPIDPENDGTFVGSFRVSDPDRDPLTVSVVQPATGTVEYDHDVETGIVTYTYRPYDAARIAAGQTQTPVQDEIRFTAIQADGVGSAPLVVDVTVTPARYTVDDDIISTGRRPNVVVVGRDGNLYVSNSRDNTISVIDPVTGEKIRDITLENDPQGIAVTEDGTMYVALPDEGVYRVLPDGTQEQLTASVTSDVVLNEDGSRLYATNLEDGPLLVINTADGTVTEITDVTQVFAVAVQGDRVYVARNINGDAYFQQIDESDHTVVGDPVALEGELARYAAIAVTPDGRAAYVTSGTDSGQVAVVDLATGSVDYIDGLPSAAGVTISPDGSLAYITIGEEDAVAVIDTATNEVLTYIQLNVANGDFSTDDAGPVDVVVGPDGTIYVSEFGRDGLQLASLTTGSNWSTPVVSVGDLDVDEDTGTVTTIITATDADGNPITVGVYGEGNGEVTLTDLGNGEYELTFTPSDAMRTAAATNPGMTQRLTIVVSDEQNLVRTPVEVPISPTYSPQITNVVEPGDPDGDGVYEGSFEVSDGDDDPLTVTVALTDDDPDGVVTYDYDETTGVVTYTYTPSQAALVRAGAVNEQITDAITFTVTDGTFTTTETVTATVDPHTYDVAPQPIGPAEPAVVMVGPDGRLYILTDKLTIVDPGDGSVTELGFGRTGAAMVVLPNGDAYVAFPANRTVVAVQNGIPTTISTEGRVTAINTNADGTQVYAASANGVHVIDTASNTVVRTLEVDGAPTGVVAVGDRVYVTYSDEFDFSRLQAFDAVTGDQIGYGTNLGFSGHRTNTIVASPDGQTLYVNHGEDNVVSVINVADGTVRQIFLSSNPGQVAVSPDGSLIYIAAGDRVVVVDSETLATLVEIDVERYAGVVAVSADGTEVYVTGDDGVQKISLAPGSNYAAPDVTLNEPSTPAAPDGAVTVAVDIADSDGDPLTVTVSSPSSGTATVVQTDDDTYTVTFSPSEAARILAASTPGEDTETITITVFDGMRSTTRDIVVTIDPDDAPEITLVSGPADLDGDGTYTTVVQIVDPEGGAVAVLGDAEKGTVTVSFDEESGNYLVHYTPTDAQRLRAGLGAESADVIVTAADVNGITSEYTIAGVPVDARALTSQSGVNLPSGTVPHDIAVGPDGSIYSTDPVTGTISRIDNNFLLNAIDDPTWTPTNLVVLSDGRAYVLVGGNRLIVAQPDLSSHEEVMVAPTTTTHSDIAANSDGTRVYIANQSGGVTVLDTSDNTEVTTIDTDDAYAVAYRDGTVYVVTKRPDGQSELVVIDTSTNTVVGEPISISNDAAAVRQITADNNGRVYVSASDSGDLTVVDLAAGSASTLVLDGHSSGMAVSPDGSLLYVTSADARISFVDTSDLSLITEHFLHTYSYHVDVTPDGNHIYLTFAEGYVLKVGYGVPAAAL